MISQLFDDVRENPDTHVFWDNHHNTFLEANSEDASETSWPPDPETRPKADSSQAAIAKAKTPAAPKSVQAQAADQAFRRAEDRITGL